jgi:sugar O-acyltransferase (sialic acid O-acetyltransferase NeuD family)
MNAEKKRRLVIFGAGKVTEVVYRHLRLGGNYDIAAFTCDSDFIPESGAFQGLPLVSFDRVADAYPPATHDMIIAIGYHGLNHTRRARYDEAKSKGYKLASLVSPNARYGDWHEMGDNCIVLDGAVLEPGVRLGNNVVIWSDVLVGHHSTIEDHCWIAGHAVFGGTATLGTSSFVGLGAIVGNEVDIGAESFLGAGVLVTKCCDAKSVFVTRDTEKFRLDSDRFLKISKIR